jgi:hypothetical protein
MKDFEESNISVFMGGKFTIKEKPKTAEDLAAMFDCWADEIRGWGAKPDEVKLSEVAMTQSGLHVTLEDGVY